MEYKKEVQVKGSTERWRIYDENDNLLAIGFKSESAAEQYAQDRGWKIVKDGKFTRSNQI